jgi:hypothetical protein
MTEKISWTEVGQVKRDLIGLVPGDRFLKKLCKGAIQAGRDKANPIRGNLVASALRELATHILHSLAPEDEVRRCVWFEQAQDTKTVTRGQRARYIVQAGLPSDFVTEKLKVDASAMAKPLLDAMDTLHKATHVKPETVIHKGSAVRAMLFEVLGELHILLEEAQQARHAIKHAVATALHNAVFESLILDTIQELDELSTHTRIDGHWIETITVRRLDATHIDYRITGEVEVELQYGSNSDVDNDIGMRSDDSYPYRAKVNAKAAKPLDIDTETIELTVDTSSFYE